MAVEFVVEDGSGKSDATSYISIADMKQYWDNRGYDYSALSDDQISILLNRSSQIVDGQYFVHFDGTRSSSTQALLWPRLDTEYPDQWTIASNAIPKEIPQAISEMAFAINGGTDPQPIQTDPGNIKRQSEKVDVITVSKEYMDTRSHPKIPAVDDVLRPLLGNVGSYGGVGLVRV